jgi:hypothetical protein
MSPLGRSRRILSAPRPTNITAPTISGTATEREVLTATSPGTWRDFPTSFSYQWRRGSTNISDATSSTYTLVAEDVGNSISVAVTATNVSGPTTAISSATANVAWGIPLNTSVPTVSGTAVELNTLTAGVGSWTSSPTSYSYQWQRLSGSTWTDISGATGSTYVIRAITIGQRIRVRVTANNPTGSSAPSFSAQTAVVLQAATGGTVSTTGNFRVHRFNSSGTLTLNRNLSLQYLIIAGGGAGAQGSNLSNSEGAGGGGAGGYRTSVPGQTSGGNTTAEPVISRNAGSYTITVGAGAPISTGTNAAGANGTNTSAMSITSRGGGGGRGSDRNGVTGGAGGGAGAGPAVRTGGSGTSGQGRNGGNGASQGAAGGGGGAGGLGANGGARGGGTGGNGGNGLSNNITGTATTRAGGGGGGTYQLVGASVGGTGGGGRGAAVTNGGQNVSGGSANTGSGGGGGTENKGGGAGGSGLVIVRYAIS